MRFLRLSATIIPELQTRNYIPAAVRGWSWGASLYSVESEL
jgi:hypothetical protein